jgi:serine/threonine-protein kinase
MMWKTKRFTEALEAHGQALEVRRKLADDYPAWPEYRFDLAASHGNLGVLLADLGKTAEAERAYRSAVDLLKKVAADFPAVTEYQCHAGGMLDNLAELLRKRSDLVEARRLLDEAVGYLQAVLKVKPRDPTARNLLSNHYSRLADTLVRLGDHDGAARAAAELPRGMPDRWRDYHEAAQFLARCVPLAEIDGQLPHAERQDVARGYSARAVQILQEATHKRIADAGQLRNDPALDPLRSREDFQQLLWVLASTGEDSAPRLIER